MSLVTRRELLFGGWLGRLRRRRETALGRGARLIAEEGDYGAAMAVGIEIGGGGVGERGEGFGVFLENRGTAGELISSLEQAAKDLRKFAEGDGA